MPRGKSQYGPEKFGKKLDWQIMILMQVDRILEALAEGKEQFINNIEGMDCICEMFSDKTYQKDLKNIQKDLIRKLEGLREYGEPDPSRESETVFQSSLFRFRAQIRLLRRKNIGIELQEELII